MLSATTLSFCGQAQPICCLYGLMADGVDHDSKTVNFEELYNSLLAYDMQEFALAPLIEGLINKGYLFKADGANQVVLLKTLNVIPRTVSGVKISKLKKSLLEANGEVNCCDLLRFKDLKKLCLENVSLKNGVLLSNFTNLEEISLETLTAYISDALRSITNFKKLNLHSFYPLSS